MPWACLGIFASLLSELSSHDTLTARQGPTMTCLLTVCTPFLLPQDSWSRFLAFCSVLRYALTCAFICLVSSGSRVSKYRVTLLGMSFVVPRMSRGFILHPVKLQQVALLQGCEI